MRRILSGFTLIEMTVVVLTLGILAMIIAPRFATAHTSTKISAVAEDLHKITEAIEYFKAANGYWPPDTAVGKMPPEIQSKLKGDELFEKPTPIGGIYDYENVKSFDTIRIRIRSTLTTEPPSIVDAQLLDAYIDDGVLTTGTFRSTVGGGYVYIFIKR